MTDLLRPTLVALSLALPALAQCPPGAAMPRDISLQTDLPDEGPAQKRLRTGQLAHQNGNHAEARKHIQAALEFHPSSPELILELLLACADDPDLLALWTDRFVRASSNDKGRVKISGGMRKGLAGLGVDKDALQTSQALLQKRVAAIVEVAKFVAKQKPTGKDTARRALLVRWACELLLAIGDYTPRPLAGIAADVAARRAEFEPDFDVVYDALAKVMRQSLPAQAAEANAPTTGRSSKAATINDQRIRAARILAGLARQVGFKDLKGPRPAGPGKLGDEARGLLEQERSKDVAEGKIWSIAELEAMTPDEREKFTQEHRDWHHCGLALSTTGRYRIETICGHETLLGVAKSIELHHERLVGHFGKDPFLQQQGIVRVVPEKGDMDVEGVPFWWAGGFQGGNKTTVRFSWGRISGLGHTLTHELTHRFDGTLRPFLPAWYSEGHATWTGGHYWKMADKQFAEKYLRVGDPATSFYKGYERKRKFVQLLEGEIEDYRDNYPVGYSLYTFLLTYPPQSPRYASALTKYERNARAGRNNPLGYFTKTFCDGKDGRPAKFDELLQDWQRFLKDCYDWTDPRKDRSSNIVREYDRRRERGDGDRQVADEPTWSWGRDPHEPFYGQQHAAAATLLLDEVGDAAGTVAAGVWSLTADGWRPQTARALARALAGERQQDANHAFCAIANLHFPEIPRADGGGLASRLPKTKALLDAIAEQTAALAAAGKPQAAAAIAREHAAIANLFGVAPVPEATADLEPRLPRHLGSSGFAESDLTGYEDRRHPGLWYVTPEGDLHVGREKPREGTGTIDRRAHQREAYAHSVMWLAPGHFVVRGRLHWTTSYVTGAIILGHTRRDRGVRINFSAGDRAYASGRSDTNDRQGRVSFGLRGLWERDGKVGHTEPNNGVEVPDEQHWVAFELHVRGPRIEVFVEGESLLRYTVHDGTPIEGHVGFAVGQGAIRVQQPTVQRLDDEITSPVLGLDISRQPRRGLDELIDLQTRGLPRNRNGTLVLWLPKVSEGLPSDRLGRALRPLSRILQDALKYPQPWVLAVPHDMPADAREATLRDIRDLRPDGMQVVEHHVGAPFTGRTPWALFIDAQGVMRAAASCRSAKLHTRVGRWSEVFRGRHH